MVKEQIRCRGVSYDIDDIYVPGEHLLAIVFSDAYAEDFISDPSMFYEIEVLARSGSVCGYYVGYQTIYSANYHTLTLSDREIDIDVARHNKINELRTICEQMIFTGVDVNGEHFSYDLEDQNNIKDAFDLVRATSLNVPYHADGESCRLFTPEEIIAIYVANKSNLTHHTTYYNQMKAYINTLSDVDDVRNIQYGDALTGEYLVAYNAMMTQAQLVIETLLGGSE